MPSALEYVTCDANEAVASVAYRLNELVAIYPITPSSPMAEFCDEWAAADRPNLWGQVPRIVEMQSEGGVAGAVHGGLLGGALVTTFTASQGLLLMIPNLYKIAGELLPFTVHVSARALAAQGLSIFGDHQDVMACRATGCALICSNSAQEAHDLALVSHAASLRTRVPFIHFFDGFRTSHEVQKLALLSDRVLRSVVDEKDIAEFRSRAMTPDHPTLRGTAQNPDVYFQGREAVNRFYDVLPEAVQASMDMLATASGRSYHLFDYHGHPQAERVVVAMGSAVETIEETVDWMVARGEKVGVVAVRLFLPFSVKAFLAALPATAKEVAVLDRTKEPGSLGEPLYLNVIGALTEGDRARAAAVRVCGGRYGLGSKEFTPGMARAVFERLSDPAGPAHFTVGIFDDVTHTSLAFDADFDLERPDVRRCVFVGLGADGTVGANKNSIKIIGEQTNNFAQGFFVYDSKKSGSVTVSHLRFGPRPIRAPYLIRQAEFVACSQFSFIGRAEILGYAAPGGTVLLNSPYSEQETWSKLPREWQETLIARKLRLFVIDATGVAHAAGMGRRTNTVLQTCFFALSGVLPPDEAVAQIKQAIAKTYGKKGEQIVQMNFAAVDAALAGLHEVKIPAAPDAGSVATVPPAYDGAPEFVRKVTARLLADKGDLMPVSAIPLDGCWPTGTSRFEKRNIALEIPVWDPAVCIQCNKCVLVCPHAAIRAKFYPTGGAGGRAGEVRLDGLQVHRVPRPALLAPGRARGLHGLLALRADLPGEGQDQPEAQGDRHGAAAAAARGRARQLGLLPAPARPGPHKARPEHGQGGAVHDAALRVLRRLRRMRRDALPEAPDAACGRPPRDRERDGLLVDLRRQPADDALLREQGRPRADLGELALRGQRGIRLRPAARDGAAGALSEGRPRAHRDPAAELGAQGRAPLRRPDAPRRGSPPSAARVAALREILRTLDGADARRLEALADDFVKKVGVGRRGRRLGL